MGGIVLKRKFICAGCGTTIQTEDKKKPGYTPPQALQREVVICQRCFRLKHYNELQDVPVEKTDFTNQLHEIGKKNALVVKIVDVFDFEGSWIPGFQRFIGKNDVLILANKIDLLPKSTKQHKIKLWIKKQAVEHGIAVKDVLLMSAEKNIGIKDAAKAIDMYRAGQDVYITGCTNVGKSTFINQLILNFGGDENQLLTTSHFPGTTLDLVDLPLDDGRHMYDTPGIYNEKQVAHFLHPTELKEITPTKEIKPRVYQLNERQTIFIGGIVRVDFVKGSPHSFVFYVDNDLRLHRTKLEKADQLYEKHKGELLSPPSKKTLAQIPPFVKHSFTIKKGKTDVVIHGLGWMAVTEPGVSVVIHAPRGVGVSIREAII